MTAHQQRLRVRTEGRGSQEITGAVNAAVRDSGVHTGLCHVFVQHTSCSLTITENADPDVRRDLETVMARLAPDGDPAWWHDLEGPDDMAAHVRSVLTDTGLSVPVGEGRLLLGTWQGIFLWEHRHHGATRSVVITVLG
ncbi:secondary thiamine-phosphate synthase enzyme YjbQ [Denitromonas sp.]|uniref:secondary thiamine-phosphate synthase enzyme YjbQ n=1 Tax=Denitromonas sp. TaxID=2734609 RepID=UPI003A8B34EC